MFAAPEVVQAGRENETWKTLDVNQPVIATRQKFSSNKRGRFTLACWTVVGRIPISGAVPYPKSSTASVST